jgi:hypothetical protein
MKAITYAAYSAIIAFQLFGAGYTTAHESVEQADPISQGLISAPPEDSCLWLAQDTLYWFVNTDGSCVQCSISICGVNCNEPAATYLLYDSPYGRKVHGGSYPGRVASYCNDRSIKAWNVTGDTTIDWCKWAANTGRFAAIGYFSRHFQTLHSYNPKSPKPWGVQNNWYGSEKGKLTPVTYYTDAEFRRLHYQSGPWVVILQRASSEPPEIIEWWR